MKLPFDMCGVSPYDGEIAKSRKEKIEEVKRE